jgi:hypothetical protein
MDPIMMMMLWNACKSVNKRNTIDKVVQSTFPGDPERNYRCFFDVLKKDNKDMIHAYDYFLCQLLCCPAASKMTLLFANNV